jgi:hypothetical protein
MGLHACEGTEATTTRPDYIVHWTGKGIEARLKSGVINNEQRHQEYIELLGSILNDGLWLSPLPEEWLVGERDDLIPYTSHAACFSEIRLSAAREHAHSYGHLGIGVSRDFVAARNGGPVAYTGNTGSMLVANLMVVRRALEFLEGQGLRAEIDALLGQHAGSGLGAKTVSEMRHYIATAMGLMRTTSKEHDRPRYELLDEHEWRVIHTHNRPWLNGDGTEDDPFRMSIASNDLRLVVFPDGETRKRALSDPAIQKALGADPGDGRVLVTLDECRHF